MTPQEALEQKGWVKFALDPVLGEWVEAIRPDALAAISDPRHADWLRCGGTWFVGVNALENDATGKVGQGPALAGAAVDFLRGTSAAFAWDKGQVSAAYPGYPRQENESDAAFRFRVDRDAAHVDGLKRREPGSRRYADEFHAFLLGIPITDCGKGASPLVVWEGSHRKMGAMFRAALEHLPQSEWRNRDLTDAYASARRECFETCRRVEIPARPGEAYVLHRHALHGISPWVDGAQAPPEGRVVVYFRPPLSASATWL